MKAKGLLVSLLVGGSLAGGPARAAVHYVDADVPPASPQTGTSWATAYLTLEPALASANPGDEIWIAEGEYFPDAAPLNVYPLVPGVTIRGGFRGDESSPAERNIAAFPTLLSGDLGRDDVQRPALNLPGDIVGTNAEILLVGTAPGTYHLDGLIISGASNAGFNFGLGDGAGILLTSSEGVTLRIEDCQVLGNTASESGAGILTRGKVEARNTVFAGNVSGFSGGGAVACFELVARECSFLANRTAGAGGAIAFEEDNCRGDVGNSLFIGNFALFGGGAVSVGQSVTMEFRNCTFAANQTGPEIRGAAMQLAPGISLLTVANCVFEGNVPSVDVLRYSGTPPSPPFGLQIIHSDIETGTNSFQDLDGPDDVLGSLDDNPRLVLGSSAIDAGEDVAVPSDYFDANNNGNTTEPTSIDWAGQSRLNELGSLLPLCEQTSGGIVDMGVTEFVPIPLTLTILEVPTPAFARHRVWNFFFSQDVGTTFGEEDLERIGSLAGISTMAFHRNGATVTVIGIPNDDTSTGTLAPRFDGRVDGDLGGILSGQVDGSLATINVLPDCATYYPFMTVY